MSEREIKPRLISPIIPDNTAVALHKEEGADGLLVKSSTAVILFTVLLA